jgi:hypothetical protein
MPLNSTVKTQLATQIDQAFDAVEAGTAEGTHEWMHESFGFAVAGRRYVVSVRPAGRSVVIRIKRT